VDDYRLADFDDMIAVKSAAVFIAIQALFPHMGQGGGSSPRVASPPTVGLSRDVCLFDDQGRGVAAMTRGLARDLGPRRYHSKCDSARSDGNVMNQALVENCNSQRALVQDRFPSDRAPNRIYCDTPRGPRSRASPRVIAATAPWSSNRQTSLESPNGRR